MRNACGVDLLGLQRRLLLNVREILLELLLKFHDVIQLSLFFTFLSGYINIAQFYEFFDLKKIRRGARAGILPKIVKSPTFR